MFDSQSDISYNEIENKDHSTSDGNSMSGKESDGNSSSGNESEGPKITTKLLANVVLISTRIASTSQEGNYSYDKKITAHQCSD